MALRLLRPCHIATQSVAMRAFLFGMFFNNLSARWCLSCRNSAKWSWLKADGMIYVVWLRFPQAREATLVQNSHPLYCTSSLPPYDWTGETDFPHFCH